MKKRVLSLFMAIVMLFGVAAPVMAEETEESNGGETFSQKLIVHKVLQDSLAQLPGAYQGEKGAFDPTWEPTGAKYIDGVYFRLKDSSGKAVAEGSTKNGQLTIELKDQQPGKYTLEEVPELSEYIGDGDEQLTGSMAVPMELTLPIIGEEGIAKTVNLFPKNTHDKPKIEKEIVTAGENPDKPLDSLDIGSQVPYKITTTIPKNAKYKHFKFSDSMSKGLELVGKPVLKIGEETLKEEHYTLESSEGDKSNFTITFNETGLEKINNNDNELTLTIEYKAVITKDAAIGEALGNDVALEYSNNPSLKDKPKVYTQSPKIYTYGRKFQKTNGEEELTGAEFIVKNTNEKVTAIDGDKLVVIDNPNKDKFMKVEEGKVTWVEEEEATKFTGGKFEVVGLQEGNYELIEIKAPNGYAKLKEPIKFTVDEDSYEAGETKVVNTKITIPQTGGIGSVIFVIAGLAIVSTAVIVLKKRRNLA